MMGIHLETSKNRLQWPSAMYNIKIMLQVLKYTQRNAIASINTKEEKRLSWLEVNNMVFMQRSFSRLPPSYLVDDQHRHGELCSFCWKIQQQTGYSILTCKLYIITVNIDIADGLAIGTLDKLSLVEFGDQNRVLFFWLQFPNGLGVKARGIVAGYTNAKRIG
ncbi:hypothetical protein TNCV_1116671 [Trichonephila clavipes]|nr:hypothetical protein TNCV_1116671 [Trichonephila clavipes]